MAAKGEKKFRNKSECHKAILFLITMSRFFCSTKSTDNQPVETAMKALSTLIICNLFQCEVDLFRIFQLKGKFKRDASKSLSFVCHSKTPYDDNAKPLRSAQLTFRIPTIFIIITKRVKEKSMQMWEAYRCVRCVPRIMIIRRKEKIFRLMENCSCNF